jgi:chitodextrinase
VFAAGASVQIAAADAVEFPDMTSGGTNTLDAGDTWTNTANAVIADNAVAVLNVNGTWSAGGMEIQLGGVNGKLATGNELQDVTLNIGATGVLDFNRMWVAGGWPGNTTDAGVEGVIINMAEGAEIRFDGSNFGPRLNGGGVWTGDGVINGGGDNAETLWEYFYNQGFLLKDGAQVGSFADNFEVVGDPANAHTLVAIPTPETVALITPSVTDGYDPLEVVFDGADSTAVGTITHYDWKFGDGNTANGVLATNTYAVAGDYTAWLTITDDQGNVASNSVAITVAAAVEANITATANGNYAPLEIIFDGAASTSVYGTVTGYLWEFGDGTSAAGMLVTHIYTEVGDYTAWLTITDEAGYMASNSVEITAASIDYGMKVDDSFDDGDIASNTLGTGSGFASYSSTTDGTAICAESNGVAVLESGLNGGRRAAMASNESADTMTSDGATYLFEDVSFGFASDDSGDGGTHRTYLGIRDTAGAGDEGINPEEGFFVEFGFVEMSGLAAGTSSFVYNNAANVKTVLANWTFDNLLITDVEISTNVMLDITIVVDDTGWSLDILGDTCDGGSAISFAGTHAASSVTNTVDTGHAFAFNQSESPNLSMSIGRVVVNQVQGSPLVVPNITSISSTDGTTVSLSWDSEEGFNYNVLSAAVLTGSWSTNVVAVPGAGSTTSTNLTPSGGAQEFFKIEAY